VARVRLQKFMAACGAGSRRRCEEYILQGGVTVNGRVVRELGITIDEENDDVRFRGRRLVLPPRKYYVLNKPRGYVTTARDEYGRPTVFDLVKEKERLFAVGRLDRDSEGLLLLTNDGAFAERVSHPRYGVPKTYEVTVRGRVSRALAARFTEGIFVRGERTAAREASVVSASSGRSVIRIVLCEGKKRQVRRMCAAVGLDVVRLKRIGIGMFSDARLRPGEYRALDGEDRERILAGGNRHEHEVVA